MLKKLDWRFAMFKYSCILLVILFTLLSAESPFTLLKQDAGRIEIGFNLPSYSISRDSRGFEQIAITNGSSFTSDIGRPLLPLLSTMITLQGDKKAVVSLKDVEMITINNVNISPTPEPTTDADKPEVSVPKMTDMSAYPKENVKASENMIWRHLVVSSVNLVPFNYNPKSKTLKVIKKATIVITFVRNDNPVFPSCPSQKVDPEWDKMYKGKIINYLSMNVGYPGAYSGPQFLIICKDGYEATLSPLYRWHTREGFYTQIIPISQIGANVNSIRTYLANAYHTYGIKYVLMVGDYTDIPMFVYNYSGYSAISDTYYAMVDGNDALSEFAIGRFASQSVAELQTHLTKTFDYILKPDNTNYYPHLPLVAHYQEAPGKYEGCCEQIVNYNYSKSKPTFERIYGSGNYGAKTNQDISNAINNGSGIILYRGHGSSTEWWQWNTQYQNYSTNDVNALNNAKKTPIVYNINCDNGDLRYQESTLQETWLDKYPGGAVSSLGSSNPSWTVNNHTLAKELIKATFDNDIFRVAFCKMFADIALNNEGKYGIDIIYMYWFNADPSLSIRTTAPMAFTMKMDKTQILPNSSTTVKVTVKNAMNAPQKGVLVCLWQEGSIDAPVPQIYLTDTTNTSGIASFTVAGQKLGWIQVTSSFKNMVPLMDSISVRSVGFTDTKNAYRLPNKFAFLGCFPNPAITNARFDVELTGKQDVSIKVYDMAGRLVKTVCNDAFVTGKHSINWDLKDNADKKVNAGVYFYAVKAGSFKEVKRLVVIE
jgi:hypothetical protein